MARAQKVIIIIVVVWWIIGGLFSFMATAENIGDSTDYLVNFLTTGLYVTIPMGFIWYLLKPRK